MTMTPDKIKGEAEELAARLLTLASAAGELGADYAAGARDGVLAERARIAEWLYSGANGVGDLDWSQLGALAGRIEGTP